MDDGPDARLAEWSSSFQREGYVHLPAILDRATCAELDAELLAAVGPQLALPPTRHVRPQMHLSGPVVESLIDRAPVVDLAERLLAFEPGDRTDDVPDVQTRDCHVINVSGMVTLPGDPGQHWHVDDVLLMPRPAGVPWDERIPFPTYLLTAMYYLDDVTLDDAPTELVPGSHKSGRKPPPHDPSPRYEGSSPRALAVAVGDCVVFHNQVWHHALPNRGRRARRVMQVHYGARFIAPRFLPFPNHHMPARFLERLTARQQRLMGMHACRSQYA